MGQKLGKVRFFEGSVVRPAGWYFRLRQGPFQGPFAFQHKAEAARDRAEKENRLSPVVIGNPCEECGFDHTRQSAKAEAWHIRDEARGMLLAREDDA
jgi:hypothetical protein